MCAAILILPVHSSCPVVLLVDLWDSPIIHSRLVWMYNDRRMQAALNTDDHCKRVMCVWLDRSAAVTESGMTCCMLYVNVYVTGLFQMVPYNREREYRAR